MDETERAWGRWTFRLDSIRWSHGYQEWTSYDHYRHELIEACIGIDLKDTYELYMSKQHERH